jgi:hypothetical protein
VTPTLVPLADWLRERGDDEQRVALIVACIENPNELEMAISAVQGAWPLWLKEITDHCPKGIGYSGRTPKR